VFPSLFVLKHHSLLVVLLLFTSPISHLSSSHLVSHLSSLISHLSSLIFSALPQLYHTGLYDQEFNLLIFLSWLFRGFAESCIIFLVCYGVFYEGNHLYFDDPCCVWFSHLFFIVFAICVCLFRFALSCLFLIRFLLFVSCSHHIIFTFYFILSLSSHLSLSQT
jgi:hypothetical protein